MCVNALGGEREMFGIQLVLEIISKDSREWVCERVFEGRSMGVCGFMEADRNLRSSSSSSKDGAGACVGVCVGVCVWCVCVCVCVCV